MPYVNASDLGSYLRNEVKADDIEVEAALITACSNIDSICGRSFTVPTTATARQFVAWSGEHTELDDIADLAGVAITVDGSTVTGWTLEAFPGTPGPVVRGRTWPWRWVRDLPVASGALLTVTAKWGWPAVPAEVEMATKLIAKDLLDSRDTRFGVATFGGDMYARKLAVNPLAVSMLSDLVVI